MSSSSQSRVIGSGLWLTSIHFSQATDANNRAETLLGSYRLCPTNRASEGRPGSLARFRWNPAFPKLVRRHVGCHCQLPEETLTITSSRFGSYEMMMRGFRSVSVDSKWKVSEGTAVFLSGGLGSNLFWIGSFPFDAVKK